MSYINPSLKSTRYGHICRSPCLELHILSLSHMIATACLTCNMFNQKEASDASFFRNFLSSREIHAWMVLVQQQPSIQTKPEPLPVRWASRMPSLKQRSALKLLRSAACLFFLTSFLFFFRASGMRHLQCWELGSSLLRGRMANMWHLSTRLGRLRTTLPNASRCGNLQAALRPELPQQPLAARWQHSPGLGVEDLNARPCPSHVQHAVGNATNQVRGSGGFSWLFQSNPKHLESTRYAAWPY